MPEGRFQNGIAACGQRARIYRAPTGSSSSTRRITPLAGEIAGLFLLFLRRNVLGLGIGDMAGQERPRKAVPLPISESA